jgi:hypothetical protein
LAENIDNTAPALIKSFDTVFQGETMIAKRSSNEVFLVLVQNLVFYDMPVFFVEASYRFSVRVHDDVGSSNVSHGRSAR